MRGAPSTYEFDAGREVAWIVAHAPEHAEAYARSRGWSAGDRKRFGEFRTRFLCECDVDALLDETGNPAATNTAGNNP